MLISFSGAQSSGKTTLLNEFQRTKTSWNYVPEITRLVRREYDLPINEDGGDLTQIMIMGEHLRNAFTKRGGVTILDRCSLDGVVYTHWLNNKKKVLLSTYLHAQYIFETTVDKYDLVIYTSPHDVPVVDDGERSIDIDFRNEIIDLFDRYIESVPVNKLLRVSGSVEERKKQINDRLVKLGININLKDTNNRL